MRRNRGQEGQTIAITLMITMLMLLLSAAVVASVVNNMREAGASKTQVTLYSAAEVGLGMAERDAYQAAQVMSSLIWNQLYDTSNPSGVLSQYFAPVVSTDKSPLKLFEYFSDLRNWPGFSQADGWFPLATGSVDGTVPFDRYYDFNKDGIADIIGESGNDDSVDPTTVKKRHFITRVWKKRADYSSNDTTASMKNRYRYMMLRRLTAGYATPSYYGWYDDLMPVDYDAVEATIDGINPNLPGYSPILKKVYTFSTDPGAPPIRVAVYVRLDMSDYTSTKWINGAAGNPQCLCLDTNADGKGDTRYHTNSADYGSDQHIARCPKNNVKFLIAAVSETTPDASSQFSQCNVTVSMGGAIFMEKAPFLKVGDLNDTGLVKMVCNAHAGDGGFTLDPGCFAPVLDPLVANIADPTKGATVSGTIVPVGSVERLTALQHWWEAGRVFLYAEAAADDTKNPKRWYKGTVFLIGFDRDTGKYCWWFVNGKPPELGAVMPAKFNWTEAWNKNAANKIAAVFKDAQITADNSDLKWDRRDAAGVETSDETRFAYPEIARGRTETLDNDAYSGLPAKPFSLKHASGYYEKKGLQYRFFIARKNLANSPVAYMPEATGFYYYASAHFIAATGSSLPARLGMAVASVSTDDILTK